MVLLGRIRTFRGKLLLLAALSSGLTALVLGATLVTTSYLRMRDATEAYSATTADVIALHSAAALRFEDKEAGAETLAALDLVPNVASAHLYNAAGESFASFVRPGLEPPVIPPGERDEYIQGRWLILTDPISNDKERIGTLVTVYDLAPIRARMRWNLVASAALGLVAAAATLLLALRLQRELSRPMTELASTARRVSASNDYSIRAHKYGDDELGQLTDVFNRMLARVQEQTQAISAANERFRLAVEAAPTAMIMVDERGTIELVNAKTEELFGYRRAELLGSHVDKLLPDRLREPGGDGQGREFFSAFAARASGSGRDTVGQRKDGSEFPVEISLSPIATDEGVRVLAAIVDLTQRRSFAEQQARLAAIIETTDDAIITLTPDGVITSFNAGAERIYGYRAMEVLGQGLSILIPPGHEDELPSIMRRFRQGQRVDHYDTVRRRKDGSLVDVSVTISPLHDAAGRLIGASKVARDITQRKRGELALRQSEARKAAIMESSLDCLITMDHHGVIVDFNPAAERTFGHPRGHAIGKTVAELIIPQRLREAHWTGLRRFLATGEGPVLGRRIEMPALRADGSEIPVELAITVVKAAADGGAADRDADAHPPFFTAYLRDITDQKRNQEEREVLLESERAARGEAERASRTKDEFLATLSHELRTPLTAILGWAQMLRNNSSASTETQQGLEIIERNARVQTQIIEDLLDMSRIISGKVRLDVQMVDLPHVVDAALGTVRPAAEAKGIRLQKIIDPRVGAVRGDPNRLQQCVWNLLTNAIKFTPRGGRVQVALERINSHVEISVSDTGEGIKPEFLPLVFERFRQADASASRRHGGLGLGLAIVKQLAELHGGRVRASSPGPGQGSTFTIELPLAIVHRHDEQEQRLHPSSAVAGPAVPAAGEPLSLKGVTVLVVEDEPDARELIGRLLEQRAAKVMRTASAAEAREAMGRVKPDVIVSDIGMPEEDGYQFIRKVRALTPERGGAVPAIALTAFARSEDRTRALLAGYQLHLAKPVEPAELLVSVASLVGLTGRQPEQDNGEG